MTRYIIDADLYHELLMLTSGSLHIRLKGAEMIDDERDAAAERVEAEAQFTDDYRRLRIEFHAQCNDINNKLHENRSTWRTARQALEHTHRKNVLDIETQIAQLVDSRAVSRSKMHEGQLSPDEGGKEMLEMTAAIKNLEEAKMQERIRHEESLSLLRDKHERVARQLELCLTQAKEDNRMKAAQLRAAYAQRIRTVNEKKGGQR